MIRKIREKIRWKIAKWLNRSPEYCWGELVSWVVDMKPWRELRKCRELECPKYMTFAYCGKCEETGKMEEYKREKPDRYKRPDNVTFGE